MVKEDGCLYLVGTPIGNLEDISLRAVRILTEADLIACEDTRETLKLLNHLGISKKMISYQKYSENEKKGYLIDLVEAGNKIALVSDAGMPGI
ncbi:MAG: 16S rRNA (cytidine(1402)-2'-O)-methyltransferase, partial [Erysipelotrichaceae bacterium]|nr:16S rRNA (cytidine(1402)-2'-O)-methyltransferase [Erysipelotrichaceae bacterium]